MAKNQMAASGAFSINRPGEGTLVELRPIASKEVTGADSVKMTASLNAVPVPNKRYSADVCFVGYSHETFKLLFAQEKINSTELRTLLVVKMSVDAVSRFLETIAETDLPFDEYAEKNGLKIEQLPQFKEEPKDTVAFDANFVLAAMSGKESCVDFYHSSAFAQGAIQASKKLALDPVVRVDLRASLLMALVREVRKIRDTLPPDQSE